MEANELLGEALGVVNEAIDDQRSGMDEGIYEDGDERLAYLETLAQRMEAYLNSNHGE